MSEQRASTPSERLAELGFELPSVVTPLGSYVPAIRAMQFVYTSGQLPMVDGSLRAIGKVGSEVSLELAAECAQICAFNALAAIDELVGIDNIVRIVKVVGFVASAPDFTSQPAVVNGASNLLGDLFGDRGKHARSAVGVMSLPLDSPVEVELIVEVRS